MGNGFPINKCINTGYNARIQFQTKYSDDDDKIDHICFNESDGRSRRIMPNDRINYQELVQTYIVSYHVGGKDVRLSLEITYWMARVAAPLTKFLRFSCHQPGSIYSSVIDVADHNLLNQIPTNNIRECYETNFANETKNRWGGLTKMNLAFRRGENEGILVVVEHKRKRGFERPFEITVTHYYAVCSKKKYEVGLSVVVDIKVLNNDLDVSWKGLSQHPSSALLQMFQQVSRTWTWKWTSCPHCADQTQIQQYETETENDDEKRDHPQQPMQIVRCTINNRGVFIGNNNGGFIFNQLRRWFN